MTEKEVKNNLGNLFRFKTKLYWYGIDWEKTPGSICIVSEVFDCSLDLGPAPIQYMLDASTRPNGLHLAKKREEGYFVNAFIDENFALIWVHPEDIELINDSPK